MQIDCKDCTCDTCKNSKVNNPPEGDKSIAENGTNNSSNHPQKQPTRSRQTKAKNRSAFGNHHHHRLDHTYAAHFVEKSKVNKSANSKKESTMKNAVVESPPPLQIVDSQECEEIVIVDIINDENDGKIGNGVDFDKVNNDEEINLKSNWLRNLCLEYQPVSKEESHNNSNGVPKDGHSSLNSLKSNGVTKQYRKGRKFNRTVSLSPLSGASRINKSLQQEDNKRWIAALALVELAYSQ